MSGPLLEVTVEEGDVGRRLDVVLAERLPDFSRTLLKKSIDAGGVSVSGRRERPAYNLEAGDVVRVDRIESVAQGPAPEAIPLSLL